MANQPKDRNPSKSNHVSRVRVMELLEYNSETGVFIRRINVSNHKTGERAGRVMWKGYRDICIDRVRYREHHLAWLIVHGIWPRSQIDHINRLRDDNRISNLRLATYAQQAFNKKVRSNSLSGKTGVGFVARLKKYQAYISIAGRHHTLGYFETFDEASKVRDAKASEIYGAFVP